jgi:hypothetical protein
MTILRYLRKVAAKEGVLVLFGRVVDCPLCYGSGTTWQEFAYAPKGWNHAPTSQEITGLMLDEGFRRFGWDSWEIKQSGSRLMHPKERPPGAVYIASPTRPMVIARRASGGDYDANDFSLFKHAADAGYDGVFIWDMAQSQEHGNVNHASIGLFKHALADLRYKMVPATYQEWEGVGKGTPEVPSPKVIDFGSLRPTDPPTSAARVAGLFRSQLSEKHRGLPS